MSTPLIARVVPSCATPGGRIEVHGSALTTGGRVPAVRIGGSPARVVFASAEQIDLLVPSDESGAAEVYVAGADPAMIQIGLAVATGLHQVDNPVFDHSGSLFVTYSGSRGQQVPVSVFRVTPGGTRESYSSSVTNPTSLAVSPDGRLYVSSRFEGAVYRLDDSGQAEVFASDLGIACGLAFAPDGRLFVGDRSGTVFEVTPSGEARPFATLPSSVAAFHLAMGHDGLYVTAPTLSARDVVYRIAFSGDVEVVHSGFGRPQGLAFAPDGALFVVEALAGATGLYRVGGGPPRLVVSGPRIVGLTFAPDGDLVVCSSDTAYRFPAGSVRSAL
jgi:sugar lactone lactonase YvrE